MNLIDGEIRNVFYNYKNNIYDFLKKYVPKLNNIEFE